MSPDRPPPELHSPDARNTDRSIVSALTNFVQIWSFCTGVLDQDKETPAGPQAMNHDQAYGCSLHRYNCAFLESPRHQGGARSLLFTDDLPPVADGFGPLDLGFQGYCHLAIVRRQEQAVTPDYAMGFRSPTTAPLCWRAKSPSWLRPGFDRVFFTNSGSESADTALKIALAYHRPWAGQHPPGSDASAATTA